MAIVVDPAAPARRSTSLDDLPRELKAHIVRLVDNEDLRRRDHLDEYDRNETKVLALSSEAKATWYRRSLGAVRLVNREWSSLADVRYFRELIPVRCRLDIFTFDIVRRYGSLVYELYFEAENEREDWISLLRSLPHFKNPKLVQLDGEAFGSLFGAVNAAAPTDEQARFRNALVASASQVQELILPAVSLQALAWVLPPFATLRALQLNLGGISDPRAPVRAIADLECLQKLELWGIDSQAGSSLGDVVEEGLWRSTSLQHFDMSIATGTFSAGIWTFIRHISTALGFLGVGLVGLVSDLPPLDPGDSSGQPTSFPLLRILEVQSPAVHLPSLLDNLRNSAVARLEIELELGDPVPSQTSAIEEAFKVLAKYPSLRHVVASQLDATYVDLDLANTFTRLAHQLGITLTLTPSYDVFLHRKRVGADPGTRQEQTDRRCDGVDELLRFTAAQSGRMRATGDLEGAEELVEALTPLRARMLRDRN